MSTEKPSPSTGQVWTHPEQEGSWRIAGARGQDFVLVRLDDDEVIVTPRVGFTRTWEFAGCDHEVACCLVHSTHTSPHKGCVLR